MALTKFSKKMTQLCAKHGCTLIGINQLRENIGSMYGGTVTPGGRAWKHACTLRMSFMRGRFIDDKNKEVNNGEANPFGNIVNVAIEKTKCCAPDRRLGHYTLRYDSGIDAIGDFVDIGMLYGLVIQGGAWFSVIDPDTGELMNFKDKDLKFQGKPKLIAALKEDQELLDFIKAKLDMLMYPED
jgi:recombination protein RecA